MTPKEFQHAHAMVLGNLLGEGDEDFVRAVKRPIKPRNVMYAGLQETSDMETAFIERLGLRKAGPSELAQSEPVLEWFKSTGAKYLAIHLDLDVLDPAVFRALLFANPNVPAGTYDGIPQGKMTIDQVVRVRRCCRDYRCRWTWHNRAFAMGSACFEEHDCKTSAYWNAGFKVI